MSNFSV